MKFLRPVNSSRPGSKSGGLPGRKTFDGGVVGIVSDRVKVFGEASRGYGAEMP